jgi:hypothetical protein
MKPGTDRPYRAAVVAIARAGFGGDEERLGAAVAAAITLVTVRDCDGCGRPYLQADGRQRRFCTERCRWRIAQRERRRRTTDEGPPPEDTALRPAAPGPTRTTACSAATSDHRRRHPESRVARPTICSRSTRARAARPGSCSTGGPCDPKASASCRTTGCWSSCGSLLYLEKQLPPERPSPTVIYTLPGGTHSAFNTRLGTNRGPACIDREVMPPGQQRDLMDTFVPAFFDLALGQIRT